MAQDVWTAVDDYFSGLLIPADDVLDAALQAQEDAGLPQINVAPNQGKLLHLIAKIHGAKRILEVGTLGGYSTIWLGRALPPDGTLVTLELDPKHAEVATANLQRAGLGGVAGVRVGSAHETLPKLAAEGGAPFDLVFIDADKPSNPLYLEWALKLTRPGSVIIIDNVVRNGGVSDPNSTDANVKGVQKVLEMVANDPRLTATAVQTVGSKGYDGFAIAVVG